MRYECERGGLRAGQRKSKIGNIFMGIQFLFHVLRFEADLSASIVFSEVVQQYRISLNRAFGTAMLKVEGGGFVLQRMRV